MGKIPKGGGEKKIRRKFPISIWEFEKPGGGGLNFSKISEFQLFCNHFAILPLSEMSEIQKVLNYPRGGGQSLIGNFSQIFPFVFSDASPKIDD